MNAEQADTSAVLVNYMSKARGLPAVALVCRHGTVTSDELQSEQGNWAVRHAFDSLNEQFSDQEMSPRAKATTALRSVLAHLLEERYACLDGYQPFAVVEEE